MEHFGQHRKRLDLAAAGRWTLSGAYAAAEVLLSRQDCARARRELLAAMRSDGPEIRKRAADVARRITEKDRKYLYPVAEELAWILAETPLAERRTRWHLGLVVARTARTPAQVLAAAELMWRLADDESNVVRCSAIEGLGELAPRLPGSRGEIETYLLDSLRHGTLAMKCRAKHALGRLNGQAMP